MFGQILAIIRNTFLESIRQPIVLVVMLVSTIALVFCNLLAGFTMDDDQRMMVDMGLSTVFLSGTLLAAFVATSVLNREIENKTALTIISKPVGRPLFVIGKYLGVAGALGICTIYLGFVFLLVEMHEVQQTVRDPIHWPVVIFGSAAAVITLAVATWVNFFYGKVFASAAVAVATPLMGIAWLLAMMWDPGGTRQPMSASFEWPLLQGLFGITTAILVLTAVAIAASTRLGQVMTLCITLGVFLLGMLSDWFFGRGLKALEGTWLARAELQGLTVAVERVRTIELVTGEVERTTVVEQVLPPTVALSSMADGAGEHLLNFLYHAGYAIVPNFQVFWLSDAVTQQHVIPTSYMATTLVYGSVQIVVALGVATLLFQRREVG